MIKYLFLFLAFIEFNYAQDKYVKHTASFIATTPPLNDSAYQLSLTIDTPNLKEVLSFLASDSCQGRELGTPGNDVASKYISNKLSEYQIPALNKDGDYFQKVDLKYVSWDTTDIIIDDAEYRQIWDYVSIPTENESLSLKSDSIIFLGYGIESPAYNDYAGVNTKGKVIVIYNGEPKNKKGINYINKSSEASLWSNLDQKLKAARNHEVKCVFVVEEKFKELADKNRESLYSPKVILANKEVTRPYFVNTVFLSSTMFSKILGQFQKKIIATRNKINKTGRPKAFYLKTKIDINQIKKVTEIKGNNILAYIEGTDKKDELVILSAHYDHIGMRGQDIFNGADDNGSGSSGLTQIARAFKIAKNKGLGPRRSVLCLFVTGEEKGLLGSMYYVNDPVFPLDKTIADINIDMIGRTDSKYTFNNKYIYVIGSDRLSLDLHKANENINQLYSQLTLDYTYNAEDDPNRYYYRSDHYNFAEKGIPSIFFFSGVHEDYHRITDDIEKIQFNKYKFIVRHAFLLAWRLSNMENRIQMNKPE